MYRVTESRPPLVRGRAVRFFLAAALAATTLVATATSASATPLSFTLFNVSAFDTTKQSRLDLKATLKLNGTPVDDVNVKAQFDPGALTGQGSLSTLYNDTASNDSKVLANVNQQSITFGGGSTAVASNAGLSILPLSISPNVGATSGSAPASYGVVATAPVIPPIALPAIDLTPFGVPVMLNLGNIISIDTQIALRDVVVDVTSPYTLLAPVGTPPPTQSFNASQLNVGIVSGTSDIALGIRVQQGSIGDWVAAGVALIGMQTVLSGAGIPLTITAQFGTLSYLLGMGISAPLPATFALNDEATLGTLEHIGANYRLTIPVKFDVVPETLPAPFDQFFTATLGLSGKLIGQTPFQELEVPEPSSVALALMAVSGIIPMGMRRLRRRRNGQAAA